MSNLRGIDNEGFQFDEISANNDFANIYRKEVLPRLENYEHMAKKRPSLSELYNEGNVDNITTEKTENNSIKLEHTGIKLGWIQGVLIPCLLNLWGVMLFLRLSWVVAETGIAQSLIIIAISAAVCIITTLSLSALCTNGEVKGGGIYYIISRSLGPEFGASIGIVFAFANAVSASMNTIGFCNSLSDLLNKYDMKIIDGGVNDTRIVGVVAILIMILICAIGMEWESKAQNFLIVTILAAMADFMVGTIIGPRTDEQRAQGFVGFQTSIFKENWGPSYRRSEGADYDFFQVFAIFFPSVTGIQAGANICGDLKNPSSDIPKGTFLSLLISMLSYAIFVVFAGGAAMRDASGNVTDLINDTLTDCVEGYKCSYGLFNSYQMMQIMSSWWPLIYAGCFAATLSTALTNLLSVPRLIQVLGWDKIYPGLIFFSKGYGKSGEPYRGYVLTFLISSAFLIIADLNVIAPLISNFYLASYALINFCTFHAFFIKPLGWRPSFKYCDTWISLIGFIGCVVFMFLINWTSSLITFAVILVLYFFVRNPDVNWGSSIDAQIFKTALNSVYNLLNVNDHVKNYQPQVLVLSGFPQTRPALIDFAKLITKNHSLLIIGDVVEESLSYKTKVSRTTTAYKYLKTNKINGFYSFIDNIEFLIGAKALLQTSGIGKLRPNILLMGFKNDWNACNSKDLKDYYIILKTALINRISIALLRLPNGFDSPNDVNLDISHGKDQNIVTNSLENISAFSKKQNKGFIDVWWLHDDGGLTLLLPYIVSLRKKWNKCKLRIFTVSNNVNTENDITNLHNLLSKFRINYDTINIICTTDKVKPETIKMFEDALLSFQSKEEFSNSLSDISKYHEFTNTYYRIREELMTNCKESNLFVISLPIPKEEVSAPLYMAWLEILTKDLPPCLLVRGNQEPALTIYC